MKSEKKPRWATAAQAARGLAELWGLYTPHGDIVTCINEIHYYVASAPERALMGRAATALRSANAVSRTIQEQAVGVNLVHPGWWDEVREGPMEASKDPARCCLFLLAGAWKWATVIVREPLSTRQIQEIGEALTSFKSAARGLPAYVQYETAEALEDDEHERTKDPGAKLVPVDDVGDELRV